jgi:hypothetical protein
MSCLSFGKLNNKKLFFFPSGQSYKVGYAHREYVITYDVGKLTASLNQEAPELKNYHLYKILGGQKAGDAIKSGAWKSKMAPCYGGQLWFTQSPGHQIQFTTSNHSTKIGLYDWVDKANNICVVSVDGDAFKATALPTTQELEQSGKLALSSSKSHSGLLSPDARILEKSGAKNYVARSLEFGQTKRILLADKLTPGQHTVTLNAMPYHTQDSKVNEFSVAGILFDDSTTFFKNYPIS